MPINLQKYVIRIIERECCRFDKPKFFNLQNENDTAGTDGEKAPSVTIDYVTEVHEPTLDRAHPTRHKTRPRSRGCRLKTVFGSYAVTWLMFYVQVFVHYESQSPTYFRVCITRLFTESIHGCWRKTDIKPQKVVILIAGKL
jgi:hypothetical protein